MKRAVVFAVILMCASLCLATTIHVPADQPTVQAGIAYAVTGDTVLVAPGTYPGRINFNGKGVVVTSTDGPEVTFLESQWTTMVSFINGEPSPAELSGFTLRNAVGERLVLITNGAEPLIQGNIFTNLTASKAVIYCEKSHPRIVRNLFYNNMILDWNACIMVYGGVVDIANNTLDRNSGGIYSDYGTTIAKNNIVTNSATYGIYGSSSDLSYNDIWNNHPDYVGGVASGTGSISEDPQFIDPENQDFRLQVTSACVDAGDSDSAYDDSDGTRNDMGAYPRLLGYPIATGIGFGASQHGEIVGTLVPTIHWMFLDMGSVAQTAYELEVGTDNDWIIAEMWSTGIVMTGLDSVIYAGTPLSDATTYYLRLRLFNGFNWSQWSGKRFIVHPGQVIHVPANQLSIQAGIDAAGCGDTVLVAPGSYPEQIDYKGKGIIVTSSDGPEVTFLNPTSTPMVSFIDGEPSCAELSGFTLRSTMGNYHVKITSGAEPLIQRNIFANLTTSEMLIFSEGGHPRIVRNLFYDNVTGHACIGIAGGVADIINNTFNGNGRGFYSFGLTIAKNNIITNSTEYGIYGVYSDLSYNDVWNNNPDYEWESAPGVGSLSADPLFCDTASGDFHLQGNSPCAPANNNCGVLIGALPVACGWSCGDINGSGAIDVGDAVRLIYYLFAGGPAPLDLSTGDVNQDGRLNVADVVYLINYIFVGGPAPCAMM